ncbi:MAG TPA: restriction endonuclease [Thermoleophilaceae bacterium]
MPPLPDASPPGKAFEGRVADAYRALGYQVTPNVQVPGKQTDLIARREIEGAPPITLAIECKDHNDAVKNEKVTEFVTRVIAQRAAGRISSGALVSANGFTADARAAASEHPYVTLLSWDELAAQILDVRHQMRDVVARYESKPIFRGYLPLGIEPLSWATLTPVAGASSDLDEVIARWMRAGIDSARSALFVLADFGAGKTTLLEHLQYGRAKAYLAHEDTRVPLFVPLRNYRETQDVTTLLRASFRDAYYRDLPNDLLWRRVHDGWFYLLLDGFDEMVERSDAARRLDLFYALLDVLRSPSPTVITSRPSYFVERGELDKLLATLREYEAEITAPAVPAHGGAFAAADRLRRKLVDRRRGTRSPSAGTDGLDERAVQVIRLLPLDRERLEMFIQHRSDELEQRGTSPDQLMAFIDRTYDLMDLATRPLLLDLVIESVLLGELDPGDAETQFGASGLYEVWTYAKLADDLDKGRTRQGGLSLDTRRLLAEELALKMYTARTLEVDFHEMLDELLQQPGRARSALEETEMSVDEIATDFATCSFVTLDQDGKCRFIHKSFRGFFVARVLKDALDKKPPLLSERLEREVLYFLGGFAPTQPGVGERLWAKFLHADPAAADLRRNALVAFLYTKPEHDTRRVTDGEIADAEFGRLAFAGTRMKRVAWRDSTVMQLNVDDANWVDVRFERCHLAAVVTQRSQVDVDLEATVIESLTFAQTAGRLALEKSTVHAGSLTDVALELTTRDSESGGLEVAGSRLSCRERGRGSLVERVNVRESRLDLIGSWGGEIHGSRSVITHSPGCDVAPVMTLTECLFAFVEPHDADEAVLDASPEAEVRRADRRTIVLSTGGIRYSLLTTLRCGVFGSLVPATSRSASFALPVAWGVLDADPFLKGLAIPSGTYGCRHGGVFFVRSDWYQREAGPGGGLSAIGQLERLTRTSVDGGGAQFLGKDLVSLLDQARAQYSDIALEAWTKLEDF